MSDEESIRNPGHLDRSLDQSDGSDHNKLHVKQGRKRSTSIKTLYSSGEAGDNVDDPDLPVMTKMSFKSMHQKLKSALNCVQDLTENIDKLLITARQTRILGTKEKHWVWLFLPQQLFRTLKKIMYH